MYYFKQAFKFPILDLAFIPRMHFNPAASPSCCYVHNQFSVVFHYIKWSCCCFYTRILMTGSPSGNNITMALCLRVLIEKSINKCCSEKKQIGLQQTTTIYPLRCNTLKENCFVNSVRVTYIIHNWSLQPFSQDYWPSLSHHLCCVC